MTITIDRPITPIGSGFRFPPGSRENLQSILNIIRNWVFEQKESFTIRDMYADPELSSKLAVTKNNMHLLDEALMILHCRTDQNHMHTPMNEMVYIPPKIVRVNRDCMYT